MKNENKEPSIVDELNEELVEQENNKLEQLIKERDEYKEKYLYALADVDNKRKRYAKEIEDVRRRSKASVLREMLNIVDTFELGIAQNQSLRKKHTFDETTESIAGGFDLIYNKLNTTLENLGCEKMQLKPDNDTYSDFDTDYHEAISIVQVDDVNLNNKIIDVQQNGYMFENNVLRHAKVIVGKFNKS